MSQSPPHPEASYVIKSTRRPVTNVMAGYI